MKKGFTLIELLVVIAIVAVSATLIGSQFYKVLGNDGTTDKFEDEVIAKSIAEAAYVYLDSRDNAKLPNTDSKKLIASDNCNSVTSKLIDSGYISDKHGLLESCDKDCMNNYYFKIYRDKDGEKVVEVYKTNCSDSDNKIEY